jgi:hypothetical protein
VVLGRTYSHARAFVLSDRERLRIPPDARVLSACAQPATYDRLAIDRIILAPGALLGRNGHEVLLVLENCAAKYNRRKPLT